jgi:hypothetical protein
LLTATAILALGAGRRAARCIDEYLKTGEGRGEAPAGTAAAS